MSSLYLHIPFCASKCHYCDFYSRVGSPEQIDHYVDLLLQDIQILRQNHPQHTPFETIYFGGGTPSLLSATHIEQLLDKTNLTFGIDNNAEITLEANPGTVQQQQLRDYHKAGLNRLSLGIQSFDDNYLKLLGRRHSSEQARQCVDFARLAGFENLSLDLIFALPQQTLTDLEGELHHLLKLTPEHISIYGLTYEEGTEFERKRINGELQPCTDDLYVEQYRLIHEKLKSTGYEHYEISNFAKPGQRCQHNQRYWSRQSCMAAGIGAHGFTNTQWGERWHIPHSIDNYEKALLSGCSPAQILELFDQQQAMQEFFYLGLRTKDGVSRDDFERTFNCSPETFFSDTFDQLATQLHNDGKRWFFDIEAWLLYDHLISSFL